MAAWTSCQTLGTPIEIDTRDRILYLEDLDIDTYELDGRLTQLRNAGKLAAAAGIVVGEMKDVGWRYDNAAFMQDLSIEDVLEEVVGPLGVPCIYGLPIGHGKHHVDRAPRRARHARRRCGHAGHRRGRHRRRLTSQRVTRRR